MQWVLSNETDLKRLLQENSVNFDIESKLLYIDNVAYDVDYGHYKNLDGISRRSNQLCKIAHKIYYDFQINAFLFCKDIYDYSTIHETPEFLYTLSLLNEKQKG